ncbi:MAG: Ig-like domain-containing protein [Candidatus Kerfeldbacteria bacterium]|nr:Ig-like domain-containing protein [Candidatus Kerfeldbacteria bacterium]
MEVFQTKTKKIILTHTHYIIISIVSAMLFVGLIAVVMGGKSPQPTIISIVDDIQPLDQSLVINFDWPIARDVEVSITPQVFGTVSYDEAVIRDQLVRTLVFTPELTWLPDTTYEITLHAVHGATPSFTEPTDYVLTFKTPPAQAVTSIMPNSDEPFRADGSWTIAFDQPIETTSSWSVRFEPAIEFDMVAGSDQESYVVTPKSKLSQGAQYTMIVSQQTLRYLFGTNEIAARTEPVVARKQSWTVREAPGIDSFAPQGTGVPLNTPITITFSENIDMESLPAYVTFDPSIDGAWATTDYRTVTFTPKKLERDMTYTVTLTEGLPTFTGGYLTESATHSFTTIGPVRVAISTPTSDSTGVSVNARLQFGFNQAVDHASAEAKLSLSPSVDGTVSWDENTMIFTPGEPFDFNTTYTATIAAGVKGTGGLTLESDYSSSFSTELSVTKLGVVYDHQDHNLSCEVATLKMALNYFGANVGEQELIDAIGFDPTPKSNGIWGDPYEAFVGDIDGHQPSTGYGVYWDPIAAAGSAYRTTRAFTGGELGHLIGEIQKGHPIVIWGTAGSGTRIDWKTPEGKDIIAVNGEHTFVVTGFVGSAAAPTKIIVMDPLAGERYLSLSHFLWMWGLLGNSGVVVE